MCNKITVTGSLSMGCVWRRSKRCWNSGIFKALWLVVNWLKNFMFIKTRKDPYRRENNT